MDDYLEGLLAEIERAKERKKRAVYRINAKVTRESLAILKRYFQAHPEYSLEIKACVSCKGTYDIIVSFS